MKHVTVWLLMLTILFCGYLISLISRLKKKIHRKQKNYMVQFTKFEYIPYTISFLIAFIVDSIHVVCAADY